MRKEEYLQQLEQLLYGIPEEDRAEAMQFYRDYLEDAGKEVEAVLHSLGSPEELAQSIQRDLYGDNLSGDYTRTYKDVPQTYPFSTGGRFSGTQGMEDGSQGAHKKTVHKGKMTTMQWILIILLCVFAVPVILPIALALIALIVALVIVVVVTVLAIGIAGIAFVIGAVAVVITAIFRLLISPFSALIMLGGGLLMVGLGFLGIALAGWFVSKVLPKIFVSIVNIFSRAVHGY